MNKKRLLDTFLELVRIDSPSFSEKKIGGYLRARLRQLGFRVVFQKYGESFNLIASRTGTAGGSRSLLLSGHMDTIEPTAGISFTVTRDRVRSTGPTVLGADDKSAIAQIIEAVTVARENAMLYPDIEIVFTSAEEKGLTGARNLDFSGLKSSHALVLDSGGPVGRLVIAAPTHHTYEMTVVGRSAHAGIEPEQGISAIRAASAIISRVPDGRIDTVTTANIGIIQGGTATNVVPKEVRIRGEVRSHSDQTLERVKKRIFDTAKSSAARAGARLSVSVHEEYRSFQIRKDDPFLVFLGAVYRTCGIEPSYVATGGGSDANIFNERGITAINISTGMQKVHSHDEFIMLRDLERGAVVVLETLRAFSRRFPDTRR